MPNEPYCEKLIGKMGYSDKHMVPPPSERGSNVVQFELTTGCSHGRCTFCDIYDGPNYNEKNLESFKKHVDSVMEFVSRKNIVDRVFIGAGNALNVDNEKLVEAGNYICEAFEKKCLVTHRLSVYGNTQDILKNGYEGMKNLSGIMGYYDHPEKLVYWGLESGNDEVLKIAGKGYDSNQAVEAGEILRAANIENSTMVMPGLGGIAYFNQHIEDTVRVLNESRPKYITFMGLQIKPNTPYETWIKRQEELNKNRNLTPYEISEQTAQIIEKLNFETTVGVHGDDIHEGFCINPVSVGGVYLCNKDRAELVAQALKRKLYCIPNIERNMPITFGCTQEQIAHNQDEISENTKAYVGKLTPSIFDKLPPQIDHIYTSFPENKIIHNTITIGGENVQILKQKLLMKPNAGIYIPDSIINKITTLKKVQKLDLIKIKISDLGFTDRPTTEQLYKRAKELGLELCTAETGLHLLLKYDLRSLINQRVYLGMKPIADSNGNPQIITLHSSPRLELSCSPSTNNWELYNNFVFRHHYCKQNFIKN